MTGSTDLVASKSDKKPKKSSNSVKQITFIVRPSNGGAYFYRCVIPKDLQPDPHFISLLDSGSDGRMSQAVGPSLNSYLLPETSNNPIEAGSRQPLSLFCSI